MGGKRRYIARKVSHTAGQRDCRATSGSFKFLEIEKFHEACGIFRSKRGSVVSLLSGIEFIDRRRSLSVIIVNLSKVNFDSSEIHDLKQKMDKSSNDDRIAFRSSPLEITRDEETKHRMNKRARVYRVEAGLHRRTLKGNYDVVLRAPREVERD